MRKVVCGGFEDFSAWFLALEIARASILKPDLLNIMKFCYFYGTLALSVTHWTSVKPVSYLDFRLR